MNGAQIVETQSSPPTADCLSSGGCGDGGAGVVRAGVAGVGSDVCKSEES